MTVTNPSLIRRLAGGAVAGLVLIVAGSGADAASPCFEVEGHYDEHAVSEGCASPVGLCIALTYSGGVRGDAFGTATSIIPTIDTGTPTAPGTGVLGFTSDSVIHATVRVRAGDVRSGDLLIKNAGVFQPTGNGDIVDLQTITGGTGGLSGASGAIRASGTFSPTTFSGSSEYEGKVCLPSR